MKVFVSALFVSVFLLSCTKNKFEGTVTNVEFCDSLSPTYLSHVKDIVDASCAVSGCHTVGFS